MTYLERINEFWDLHELHSFRSNEIALFFYLLKINNQLMWVESFERTNKRIESDLDITYKALSRARNMLKKVGIIDFKSKKGASKCAYTFWKLPKVMDEVRDEVMDEVMDEPILRKNKTKNKTKTNTPPNPQGGIVEKNGVVDFSFVENREFMPMVSDWLEYKRQRGQSYKSKKSMTAMYNDLVFKSRGDPRTAQAIVNQSMASNWSGLFELKSNRVYASDNEDIKSKEQRDRDFYEYAMRKLTTPVEEPDIDKYY